MLLTGFTEFDEEFLFTNRHCYYESWVATLGSSFSNVYHHFAGLLLLLQII